MFSGSLDSFGHDCQNFWYTLTLESPQRYLSCGVGRTLAVCPSRKGLSGEGETLHQA